MNKLIKPSQRKKRLGIIVSTRRLNKELSTKQNAKKMTPLADEGYHFSTSELQFKKSRNKLHSHGLAQSVSCPMW